MRPRPVPALVAMVLALGSCATEPSTTATLEANLARWTALGITDYSYVLQISCFCPPPLNDAVVVRVSAGAIVSRTYEGTQTPVDSSLAARFPTIDSLFGVARYVLRNADAVTLEYDQTFRFPSRIQIDWIKNAVDDESTYSARGFLSLR